MHTDFQTRSNSYLFFVAELQALLKVSGIAPLALFPILATHEDNKNRLAPETNPTELQIGKVIVYMETHLEEALTLDDLAGSVGLSKYQLIRRFREKEGTTPWKFLIAKRIEKVKVLLEKGIAPAQAATEAGFYDQSHLHKVFYEKIGLTPKEYQEKNFRNKN